VLVEEDYKGRWRGRSPHDKIVFFDDPDRRLARVKVADVEITWTGPWSMQGRLRASQPVDDPLIVLAR